MNKSDLFNFIDSQKNELARLAYEIFDNPEYGLEEHFASGLLKQKLRSEGFALEEGVGGLETAYRAVWKNGVGGPNIGLLGEYDGVRGMGHACGHHLQSPAAIGAAMALKKAFDGTDMRCTVTVYGTPAEETVGGKILMAENGCFKELDIAIGCHAIRDISFVGGKSLALAPFRVTFKGKSAHASGASHEVRSAMDAMLLAFNGIEFMREHVKDDTRISYNISSGTGPFSEDPEQAKASVSLRAYDEEYLKELERRLRNIIAGACLMTDTQAEIENRPVFAVRRPNAALGDIARANMRLAGAEHVAQDFRSSGGSTDFGNVSRVVPGALVYLEFCDAPAHSKEWHDAGKTEAAQRCLMYCAKTLAGMAYDLITSPEKLAQVKEAYRQYRD